MTSSFAETPLLSSPERKRKEYPSPVRDPVKLLRHISSTDRSSIIKDTNLIEKFVWKLNGNKRKHHDRDEEDDVVSRIEELRRLQEKRLEREQQKKLRIQEKENHRREKEKISTSE